jgi:hypothetical protein
MIIKDENLPALPEWDDLTEAEHDEHRAECPDGCRFCDGHRGWGTCPSCGVWPKETDDRGESICCGSYIILDPTDGGPIDTKED